MSVWSAHTCEWAGTRETSAEAHHYYEKAKHRPSRSHPHAAISLGRQAAHTAHRQASRKEAGKQHSTHHTRHARTVVAHAI